MGGWCGIGGKVCNRPEGQSVKGDLDICPVLTDIDDEDFPHDPEDDIEECGLLPDGTCQLAGTEWCDWDCPRG